METNNQSEEKLSKGEVREMISGLKEVFAPKSKSKIQTRSDYIDKGGYYNEKEAKLFLPVLDEIFVDKDAREFRYEDYPQWTPNTIWAKINQAIKYIVDHLDTPEEKYRILRNCLRVSKGETGILFTYVENPYTQEGWVAHKIKNPEKMLEDYKTKVYKFMEESLEGEEFDLKDGISLTDEEVDQMKMLLSDSPIFLAYVSNTRIKIIHSKKIKEDEQNANT